MKSFKINLMIAFAAIFMLSSCSQRLIDFTVISSKNTNLMIDKSQGKFTEGKSMKIFAIGVTIKDAMDNALQNAGPQYDMLIDGVVRIKQYPFYGGYVVEGTAVVSGDLRSDMGDEEFQKLIDAGKIFDPSTAEVIEE